MNRRAAEGSKSTTRALPHMLSFCGGFAGICSLILVLVLRRAPRGRNHDHVAGVAVTEPGAFVRRAPEQGAKATDSSTTPDGENQVAVQDPPDAVMRTPTPSDADEHEVLDAIKRNGKAVRSVFVGLGIAGLGLAAAAVYLLTVNRAMVSVAKPNNIIGWLRLIHDAEVGAFGGRDTAGDLLVAVAALLALTASLNIALALPDGGSSPLRISERVQMYRWRVYLGAIGVAAGCAACAIGVLAVASASNESAGIDISIVMLAMLTLALAATVQTKSEEAIESALRAAHRQTKREQVNSRLNLLGAACESSDVDLVAVPRETSDKRRTVKTLAGRALLVAVIEVAALLALLIAAGGSMHPATHNAIVGYGLLTLLNWITNASTYLFAYQRWTNCTFQPRRLGLLIRPVVARSVTIGATILFATAGLLSSSRVDRVPFFVLAGWFFSAVPTLVMLTWTRPRPSRLHVLPWPVVRWMGLPLWRSVVLNLNEQLHSTTCDTPSSPSNEPGPSELKSHRHKSISSADDAIIQVAETSTP